VRNIVLTRRLDGAIGATSDVIFDAEGNMYYFNNAVCYSNSQLRLGLRDSISNSITGF